jgi:hypothetical protein
MPELNAFLSQELPTLLAGVKYEFTKPVVVLLVVVPGHRGLRTHYEMTADGVTAKSDLSEVAPDVTLAIQLPELEQLRSRSLNVQEAMVLGRIQLFGDPAIAARLGRLLSGSSLWGAPVP